MTELLIGCGHRKEKQIWQGDEKEWKGLVTLDINPDCNPDVVHDLNVFPYPFEDNKFDEIHAYEVLEHCGTQGDAKFFFGQFDEFYRILKPGGLIIATVPLYGTVWAWGDPSHTRVIQREQLFFLDRDFYNNLGNNPSSDFRRMFKSNFKLAYADNKWDDTQDNVASFVFVLKAIKDGQ